MSLLLDHGQDASLVLQGGWRTEVVVVSADAESAQVEAATGHLRLPDRLDWTGATLEWNHTTEGLIRRSGVLSGGDDAGLLRMTGIGERPFEQRRRHERVRAELDARIVSGELTHAGKTLDVSVDGMLLGGMPTLEIPGEIGFTLFLSGAAVTGDGVLVRTTEEGAHGVHFDAIDGVGASTLQQWLGARIDAD